MLKCGGVMAIILMNMQKHLELTKLMISQLNVHLSNQEV